MYKRFLSAASIFCGTYNAHFDFFFISRNRMPSEYSLHFTRIKKQLTIRTIPQRNSFHVCHAIKFPFWKLLSSFYRIYSFLLRRKKFCLFSASFALFASVLSLTNIKCYNFCSLLKVFRSQSWRYCHYHAIVNRLRKRKCYFHLFFCSLSAYFNVYE